MLAEEEIERYSRQLILKGWSARFQYFLSQQRVTGLSAYPTAQLYLAAAGVGTRAGEPNTPITVLEEGDRVEIRVAGRSKIFALPPLASSMREPFVGSLVAAAVIQLWREHFAMPG